MHASPRLTVQFPPSTYIGNWTVDGRIISPRSYRLSGIERRKETPPLYSPSAPIIGTHHNGQIYNWTVQ